MKHSFAILILAITIAFFLGCGGGATTGSATTGNSGGNEGGDRSGPPISVSISPPEASLKLNGSQQYSATVTNSTNKAVTWSVVEGAAGGTISTAGLYKAPTNKAGVFHVQAVSQADKTKNAVVPVTVHLTIEVSPPSATINLGDSQTFTSTIVGSTNETVKWSVQEGSTGGTVTSSGVYKPALTTGTFHVVAQSEADSTESAVATVVVIPAITVTISPTGPSLALNGSQQFSATVANSTNKAVDWKIVEGAAGGTVSTSGLYKAPVNEAGVFHVEAISQADATKTATAKITVNVNITVSPPSATVTLAQNQTFTATVVGSPNKTVSWSVREGAAGGTISGTGVYKAPPNAVGTFHVVAQSGADAAESAVAAVMVQAGGASVSVH